MQLTPRRRTILAILVSSPFAYLYLGWAVPTVLDLYRYYRSGRLACAGRWADVFNSCRLESYSPALAWTELIVATAIMFALAYALARWVVRPVRDIADVVDRFGPTSIGLRLRAAGPHDETRRLSDAIDRMLDRLATGYEAQRRFASNASHELRTPLATQRALIEISLAQALTSEQLELVARQLLATNERNERLVDGLLTLAETERGLMTNTALRLDAITADVVESQRHAAQERGITIESQLATVAVAGEQPLLERLVSNLVGNAVKYNDPGGVVTVTLAPGGLFTVSNTGPVIAPDQVVALFEPFRRLSGERLDHGGGVGLGLTVVASIVAAHRGSVRAVANPGGGLTVQVQLIAVAA